LYFCIIYQGNILNFGTECPQAKTVPTCWHMFWLPYTGPVPGRMDMLTDLTV